MKSKSGLRDFLLEIGCEELPADYMPGALDWNYPQGMGLSVAASFVLDQNKIAWKELRTFGTPRRLVLLVSGIEPQVHEAIEGPPLSVAFDAEGKPTRAAEAFAQKCGVKVSQLIKKETNRGPRLVSERSIPVKQVLAAAIPQILQKIAFQKTMRWDSSGARFARPVRWQLSLYGPGSATTFVGRPAAKKPVRVTGVSGYFSALKRSGIELEQGQPLRRDSDGTAAPIPFQCAKKEGLRRKLEAAALKLGGRLPDQTTEEFDGLLNTVTFLSEEPVVGVGSFRPEYLDLPAEVIETAMAKHLKLFSVRAKNGGRLLPKFLAVLEGKPGKPARVMANMDRIIEARFTDARFFYEEDTKARLEGRATPLSMLTFHEKLGSVSDRIPRLERLMRRITDQVKVEDPVRASIETAADLAKTDLVTQMVREYPSLQGVIGSHYARLGGESDGVVAALREQYQPRAAGDPVPATALGAVLSLADRLDALIGYFGVGLKPTGSADPYGLRRLALGVVRILMEPPEGVSFVGLSIDTLVEGGIQSWGSRIKLDPAKLKEELVSFLRERFETLSFVNRQRDRSLIAAVLAADGKDFAGAHERLELLQSFWSQKQGPKRQMLERAAKVAERTGRIVESVRGTKLPPRADPSVFREAVEKELLEKWNQIAPQVKSSLDRRQFEQALRLYGDLHPLVHRFFQEVFVMDEDLPLRHNRLALMREIFQGLAAGFADLSKLSL